MVGIRMIVIMAIVGGLIAYIADNMGSKIGKKRMSVFGLRPKHTSILLTVLSGMLISVLTIGVMAISSESARTALFGMEKIKAELKKLMESDADDGKQPQTNADVHPVDGLHREKIRAARQRRYCPQTARTSPIRSF